MACLRRASLGLLLGAASPGAASAASLAAGSTTEGPTAPDDDEWLGLGKRRLPGNIHDLALEFDEGARKQFQRADVSQQGIGDMELWVNLAQPQNANLPGDLAFEQLKAELFASAVTHQQQQHEKWFAAEQVARKKTALKQCLGRAAGIVEHLVCPLSGEILREPVIDFLHGRTFEGAWIRLIPEHVRPRTVEDRTTKALVEALAEGCPEADLRTPARLPQPRLPPPPGAAPFRSGRARHMDDSMLQPVLERLSNDTRAGILRALTDNCISFAVMRKPMTPLASGHTFDGEGILEWLAHDQRDPLSKAPLTPKELVGNLALRGVLGALEEALPPDEAVAQALAALKGGTAAQAQIVGAIDALEAAWQAGLGEVTERTVAEALARAFRWFGDGAVRTRAADMAIRRRAAKAMTVACVGGKFIRKALREDAFRAFDGVQISTLVAAFAVALKDTDWYVRALAALALASFLPGAVIAGLDEATNSAVATALAQAAFTDKSEDVRSWAGQAWRAVFNNADARRRFSTSLDETAKSEVATAFALSLGQIKDKKLRVQAAGFLTAALVVWSVDLCNATKRMAATAFDRAMKKSEPGAVVNAAFLAVAAWADSARGADRLLALEALIRGIREHVDEGLGDVATEVARALARACVEGDEAVASKALEGLLVFGLYFDEFPGLDEATQRMVAGVLDKFLADGDVAVQVAFVLVRAFSVGDGAALGEDTKRKAVEVIVQELRTKKNGYYTDDAARHLGDVAGTWLAGCGAATKNTAARALAQALADDEEYCSKQAVKALDKVLSAADFGASLDADTKAAVASALVWARNNHELKTIRRLADKALKSLSERCSYGSEVEKMLAEARTNTLRGGL